MRDASEKRYLEENSEDGFTTNANCSPRAKVKKSFSVTSEHNRDCAYRFSFFKTDGWLGFFWHQNSRSQNVVRSVMLSPNEQKSTNMIMLLLDGSTAMEKLFY